MTFSRRGACPALSAPMQTGDGLLVRLNPVAGGVSPNALIGLCESAARHGNGIMEVTARGSLQLRGLTAESAPLLAAEVDRLGIVVRTGIPVETGPLAGLDPQEIADPRPLAERIRAGVKAADLGNRLGPKVSVVIDGGGRLSMDTVLADVRLVAERQGAEVFWRLAVGGDGTTSPLASLPELAAADATLAILAAIAALGREGRARDLTPERLASLALASNGSQDRSSVPLGIFPLAESQYALTIALPFGSMPAETLIALANAAASLGASEIRFAPRRTLLVLGLSEPACAELRSAAASLGFVTDPADPRTKIAACPGAPACASGHIATRKIAEEIAKEAGDIFDPTFSLHVSGCAKGCAYPAEASLTLTGGEKGAGLVVSGTAKGLPAAYTPGYEAARGFGRVAKLLRNQRRPGETTASCLARLGETRIAAAFHQG
ncbi:precorrin-3B synthase [Allomesorhizobium camelthorni]|uniref:Precorrin-3B synthase n=1 Tax=Allomesorhizobium camelthorni TaxID=475069 RepID=A0A6G4W7E9_9HYPH|nr:precorrin-3B synthase [Mesorhizobium camelthorni]NGO50529.1 precorrin-3B synthase [Mesorhizobium camelthorni]